jgi:hypothetical protein
MFKTPCKSCQDRNWPSNSEDRRRNHQKEVMTLVAYRPASSSPKKLLEKVCCFFACQCFVFRFSPFGPACNSSLGALYFGSPQKTEYKVR